MSIDVPASGTPDFSPAWSLAPTANCDATRSGGSYTALETAALKAGKEGSDDETLNVFYGACATVDTGDVYIEPGFTMSEGQAYETTGMLLLCPKHPHAAKWRQAIGRGLAQAGLEHSGRSFSDGDWRVGSEIKPGTYFVTDVENCYWERQNRNGNIIANNFVIAAKRVQVTIRSSDYAFLSQGCGQWEPVK